MNWLRRFMMGRYGMDQLNLLLVLAAFVLDIVSAFAARGILSLAALVLLIWSIVRMLSRNLAARQQENVRFLRFAGRIRAFIAGFRARWKDRKTHRVFKCPSCGQKVRVPKDHGRVRIKCPQCRTKFERKT